MKTVEEHGSRLGNSIAVAVTEQRDAIGTRYGCPRDLREVRLDLRAQTLALVWPRRRVRLRHQHVAVRQHVQPARMVELGRELRHIEPCGNGRLASSRPPDRLPRSE